MPPALSVETLYEQLASRVSPRLVHPEQAADFVMDVEAIERSSPPPRAEAPSAYELAARSSSTASSSVISSTSSACCCRGGAMESPATYSSSGSIERQNSS